MQLYIIIIYRAQYRCGMYFYNFNYYFKVLSDIAVTAVVLQKMVQTYKFSIFSTLLMRQATMKHYMSALSAGNRKCIVKCYFSQILVI